MSFFPFSLKKSDHTEGIKRETTHLKPEESLTALRPILQSSLGTLHPFVSRA